MYPLLSKRSFRLWLLPLGLLIIVYLAWANTLQIRSAHGGWITDFNDPRKLIGVAEAVFVARIIEQAGTDSTSPFPQTQFKAEVLQTIKSVQRINPKSFESLPAKQVPLPQIIIVDQYGGEVREITGKRTLVLMENEPLLVPGQIYALATAYDPDNNWYHVLPHGVMPIQTPDRQATVVTDLLRAKQAEIPFTFPGGEDTPDLPANGP
jgi:hypothetical protein